VPHRIEIVKSDSESEIEELLSKKNEKPVNKKENRTVTIANPPDMENSDAKPAKTHYREDIPEITRYISSKETKQNGKRESPQSTSSNQHFLEDIQHRDTSR
jgi:hypothetical protein